MAILALKDGVSLRFTEAGTNIFFYPRQLLYSLHSCLFLMQFWFFIPKLIKSSPTDLFFLSLYYLIVLTAISSFFSSQYFRDRPLL